MSDLISREALLEALKKSRKHHAQNGRELELLCRCENIVNEQPTFETVPKSYADQIRWERDIAIEQLNEIGVCFGQKMDDVKKKLESLQWNLCSEKLPEKRDWYLAVFKEPDTGFIGLPYIADYLMGNHTAYTTKDGWIIKDCTDRNDCESLYHKNLECVAWMPLPEPYKGE